MVHAGHESSDTLYQNNPSEWCVGTQIILWDVTFCDDVNKNKGRYCYFVNKMSHVSITSSKHRGVVSNTLSC